MTTMTEFVAKIADGRTVTAVSDGKVTSRAPKRVHTMRGVQNHWGYYGFVYVTYDGARRPEPVRCCFHTKPGAARKHAESLSRAFTRLMRKAPSR